MITESQFFKEFLKVSHDMWLKGWDERNGGNMSYRLTEAERNQCISNTPAQSTQPLFRKVRELAGEAFLITGAGKYFRNIQIDPESSLGIISIDDAGENYSLHWGFRKGGQPTSEMPTHFLTHVTRMQATNGQNRVVLHSHATNLIALTFVLELDATVITRALWEMISECIIVFPEGIGVLPWMMPGSDEIGEATAELMKTHAMVLWAHHGVFGTGATIDEAFGLVDTAEKAAEILVKVMAMGGSKLKISASQLQALAAKFGVEPMKGVL